MEDNFDFLSTLSTKINFISLESKEKLAKIGFADFDKNFRVWNTI